MARTALILALLLVATQVAAQETITAVWAVDDCERVQQTNLAHFMKANPNNATWAGGQVYISGARNEIVAFQLILENGTGSIAHSINVTLPYLQHATTAERIDNTAWSGNVFDYVGLHIERFVESYKYIAGRTTDVDNNGIAVGSLPGPDSYYTGWMPDALIPAEADSGNYDTKIGGMPFDIKSGQTQGVWFDIYIPRTATAGEYNGTISVVQQGVTQYEIRINLTVYGFNLSDTTHFPIHLNMHDSTTALEYRYGISANNADTMLAGPWMRTLHRHRISIACGASYPRFVSYFGSNYTGARFDTDSLYEGPGEGIGMRTYFIKPLENILTIPSGAPPSVSWNTTYSTGPTTESNWQFEADRWAAWKAANTAAYTSFIWYTQDEPMIFDWDGDSQVGGDEADDSSRICYAIRTASQWLKDATGGGQNLPRTVTGTIWGPYQDGGTGEVYDRVDGGANYVTMQATPGYYFWGWAQIAGIQLYQHADNTYFYNGSEDVGKWRNMSSPIADGDSVSVYNSGWPAWGQVGVIDMPPASSRIATWIAFKYGYPDLIWNWDCTQYFSSSTPVDSSYWTMVYTTGSDFGYNQGTVLYPGKDVVNTSQSRNLNGPVVSIRVKALRRAVQDYEYFQEASDNGIDISTEINTIVHGAFDDFNATNFLTWNDPPHPDRGYSFEAVRKQIAGKIPTSGAPPVVNDTTIAISWSRSLLEITLVANTRIEFDSLQRSQLLVSINNPGSYSVQWPSSVLWPGGQIPTQTPGKRDLYIFTRTPSYVLGQYAQSYGVIAAPSAPVATAASSVGETSFQANWQAVTGASGYEIDVDDNSNFASPLTGYNDLNVGNVLLKSVTGLTASTPYYYRLRAYGPGGTSINSNPITVTTTSGSCESPPWAVDFTAFDDGELDGQYYWDDLSAGNNAFYAISSSGVRSSETGWAAHILAYNTNHCDLTVDKQEAYFIYGQDTGGGWGENVGIAVRANAAGDTLIWFTYNKLDSVLAIGYRKAGTSTQVISVSQTVLIEGDSLVVFTLGDSVWTEKNGSPIASLASYDNAAWPTSGTLTHWGTAASGYSSPNAMYLRRIGANNWTP